MTTADMIADGARRTAEVRHAEALSVEEIEDMLFDGIVETADGCSVEPDGRCSHGYRSPLRVLGYI